MTPQRKTSGLTILQNEEALKTLFPSASKGGRMATVNAMHSFNKLIGIAKERRVL